jgi:hypothetical protein
MRSGLAVLLGLVFCVGATAARGQTCEVPNGNFTEGTVHWSFEITGGLTYVRFPATGTDGMAEIVADNSSGVGYGTSKAVLRRGLNCAGEGFELRFRVRGSTGGQKATPQTLTLLLDGTQHLRITFSSSSFDQTITIPWPSGYRILELTYEALPCIECIAYLRLDDFRFQAIETPVLPVTWSRVKSRFP